jgi:hypothetical protein
MIGLAAHGGAGDVRVKLDDRQHQGYFDPHTHWPGGILPWKAYLPMVLPPDGADPEAFRKRAEQLVAKTTATLTQDDYRELFGYYKLLFNEIKELIENGALRDSPRLAAGAKAVVDCPLYNAPEDTPAEKTAKFQAYEMALRRLLTSSVRTDYDSAYAIRKKLTTLWLALNPRNRRRFTDRLLLELAVTGITYSEQSADLDDVVKTFTEKRLVQSARRIKPLLPHGAPLPTVRFLVQFTTHLLSQEGADEEDQWRVATADGGSTVVSAGGRIKAETRALAGLAEHHVLSLPQVSGVTVLAPEKNCFTDKGMDNFKALVKIVFAQAWQLRKRLVIHAHVGEGFPLAEDAGVDCDSLEGPPPRVLRDDKGVPLHYLNAAANVERLLTAMEEIRKDKSIPHIEQFDSFVEVRFGHVTHATSEQAARMHRANIWADINLTSNIVTGALAPEHPEAHEPNQVDFFEDHSLVDLMAEGASIILGTDGAGVEHSGFAQETLLAEYIFDHLPPGTVDQRGRSMVGNAKAYVNEMLRLGRVHVDFMQRRPERKPDPRREPEAGAVELVIESPPAAEASPQLVSPSR